MTRRKNDQGEYTIQADVGPGDKTGIYYITFCNLPFDTSWQQLKDWLRPVCKVDHVAVFEKSTSGWVRVSGKENFENAWKLLDGGVFHGRSIIASDRNRTETIKIKSMLDFSTGPTRDRQRAGAGPLTQPATPTAPYSPIPSLATTSHHADGMYTHPPAMGPYPGVYPPDIDRAGGYAAPPMPQYHVAMPGPVPVAAHGVVQYTGFPEWPQGRTSYQGKHRASDHGFASSVSEAYTTTKPTKIYIKNLARRISAKEIDHWIRRKVKNDTIGIDGIDVPVDDKGGNLGSAFVRLNNQIDPKHIVKSLHHVNFRGRTVSAWVVHDEDVKRSKGPPSEPRATRKHREGKAPADDKHDSQKHCRHSSSSVKASSNDIVVAQGSSQKGKTKAP